MKHDDCLNKVLECILLHVCLQACNRKICRFYEGVWRVGDETLNDDQMAVKGTEELCQVADNSLAKFVVKIFLHFLSDCVNITAHIIYNHI